MEPWNVRVEVGFIEISAEKKIGKRSHDTSVKYNHDGHAGGLL